MYVLSRSSLSQSTSLYVLSRLSLSQSTSLCLDFLTCKVEIIIVLNLFLNFKFAKAYKALRTITSNF